MYITVVIIYWLAISHIKETLFSYTCTYMYMPCLHHYAMFAIIVPSCYYSTVVLYICTGYEVLVHVHEQAAGIKKRSAGFRMT